MIMSISPRTEGRCTAGPFIIDVQSKLEPDPNDITAGYMRILIHTMNNSIFPNTDPSSTTWDWTSP